MFCNIAINFVHTLPSFNYREGKKTWSFPKLVCSLILLALVGILPNGFNQARLDIMAD